MFRAQDACDEREGKKVPFQSRTGTLGKTLWDQEKTSQIYTVAGKMYMGLSGSIN